MIEIMIVTAILALVAGGLMALFADLQTIRRSMRIGAVAIVVALGLFFASRGLALFDIPLGAFLMLMLHGWASRGFAGSDRLKDWIAGWGSGADLSRVETAWIRGAVDRETGGIDAEVLQGRFRGTWLHQLDPTQLQVLLADCRDDRVSQRFVGRYVERVMREGRMATPSGAVTREQALQILGLEPGATDTEIREAHRRLMTRLHPDQGGTTWLAQQLNAARDTLIGKSR